MVICKIGSVVAVEIMGTMKSIILTKNFLRTIILTKDILTTIILTTIILTKLKKINFRSGGFLAVPDVPGAADVIAAQEAIIRFRMITMIATIACMISTYHCVYDNRIRL